ncbi:ROK family transcriptional regulator [Ilumatobacter nonamiensis]|uniref:ROK family transcriptional regulator n=1 Tax=Ilumatobacter nonamiensis TaxID=467093 RepID=UPI000687DFB7|nr:ROK family transcriptional regulator [Ilumatobacter nonamiensis]
MSPSAASPAARWPGNGATAQRLGPSEARSHHRRLVLQALYRGRGLSRADLSRELGLSRVTISDVVGDLIEEGLVLELGTRASSRPGKPATMLDINREGRNVIGLDLSSSHAFVGVVTDLDGAVVERAELGISEVQGEEAVVAVETLLTELVALAPLPVVGVGVGSPGIVDDQGVVLSAPNLGWQDVPLQARLAEVCGLPVAVANDANAAAVGELSFGEGQLDMMLVRIGRGVGSGLIIDGRIVSGARHSAGEIGHVVSGTDVSEPCVCGNNGCLERWLAIPRIDAHLAEPSADRDAVLTEAGRRLGMVLAPIVSALNLTEVVLAGPASHISGPLLASAQSTLRDRVLADAHGDVQLRMTELGHDLIVLGAVVLVLRGQLGVS